MLHFPPSSPLEMLELPLFLVRAWMLRPCSPGFHRLPPARAVIQSRDPGTRRESPGVELAWPPSSLQGHSRMSEVYSGTGMDDKLALPVPEVQDRGGGGSSNPSSAHTRALEPQFSLSVK